MGPRSFDRGNAINRVREAVMLALQWGRAQMSTEMSVASSHPAVLIVASMGPRSNDRGNRAINRVREAVMLALQWGRDQMIAEIAAAANDTKVTDLLQWGRDQMIAEIAQSTQYAKQ